MPNQVLVCASPLPMESSPLKMDSLSRLATPVGPLIQTTAHARIAERAPTQKDATTPCSPRPVIPRISMHHSSSTVSLVLQASHAMDILPRPAPVALVQDTAKVIALMLAPPLNASMPSPRECPSSLALLTPTVMQLA